MRVLVVDVGGTNVKILASGETTRRKLPSGPTLTPTDMVAGVKALATDWSYDVVAIGYPGRVAGGRIMAEPRNLAPGWVGFDFESAFGCPVKLINDAAMQALGNHQGGLLLFLGLGTGLGAALVADGVVIPMELAHLPFKDGTYEHYLGVRALKRLGRKEWQKHVEFTTARLVDALSPDDIVLGGGNAKRLTGLPKGCRLGSNDFAFTGGFRLWEPVSAARSRRAKRAKVAAQ